MVAQSFLIAHTNHGRHAEAHAHHKGHTAQVQGNLVGRLGIFTQHPTQPDGRSKDGYLKKHLQGRGKTKTYDFFHHPILNFLKIEMGHIGFKFLLSLQQIPNKGHHNHTRGQGTYCSTDNT